MKIKEDFNSKYFNKNCKPIIAVDFDDTITKYRPYPERAPLDKIAFKYLSKLHNFGFRIILWTAREGLDYNDAYQRCVNEFKMPFIENGMDNLKKGETGKISAQFYIDDRSYVNGAIPWRKIYKFLMKKYKHNC